MSGIFITFEGGEGCGKSTQQALLAERLRAAGVGVTVTREPGGTATGERIRALLLDPATGAIDPRAELLLYEASRAQLVAEVIRPALARDEVVLCDRFYDSSAAYQGHARGLDLAEIDELNRVATGGLAPDVTLLFDLAVAEGLARATGSGADRLESEDLAFHERVRTGFLAIAAAEPQRFAVIDASGTPAEVADRVAHALRAAVPALAAALEGRS